MKRGLTLFLTVFVFIGTVLNNFNFMTKFVRAAVTNTLPKSSIVVGDKVYTSSYVQLNKDDINSQIMDNYNRVFSIDENGKILDKDGRESTEANIIAVCGRKLILYATSSDLTSQGLYSGILYIADGSGTSYKKVDPENPNGQYGYVSMNFSFSGKSGSYNFVTAAIKEIVAVPNAQYYIVSDRESVDIKNKKYIYEPFSLITASQTFYVSIYSASGELVGRGVIKGISESKGDVPVLIELYRYIPADTKNPSGNISNTGFAVSDGSFIYYANLSDGGKIYKKSIEGVEEYILCEDNARYLNIAGDWLFYSNLSDGGKIYRVKIDGTGRKKLNEVMSSYLNVVGDNIYYANAKDRNRIYKIKTYNEDPKEPGVRLTFDSAKFIVVRGNNIYYSNSSDKDKLYSITVYGDTVVDRTKFYTATGQESPGVRFISITNDGEIYAAGVDGKLYKTISSSRITPVFVYTNIKGKGKDDGYNQVEDKVTVINAITSNDIFYRSYRDGYKLYKLDGTLTGTKIVDDSVSYINVVEDYVFYIKGGKLFRIRLGKDEKPEAVAKQKFTEKIMMIDPIEPMELRDYKNPPLPDKVTAIMSDGSTKELVVNWDLSKIKAKSGEYVYSGKVVGYGTKVEAKGFIYSEPVNPNNVFVENNEGNGADTVTISGLVQGDEIVVYDSNDLSKPLGKGKADKNGKVIIKKLNLDPFGGFIAVTLKRGNNAPSKPRDIQYPSETPTILNVQYIANENVYRVTYKGLSDKVYYSILPNVNQKVGNSNPMEAKTLGTGQYYFDIPKDAFVGFTENQYLKLAYNKDGIVLSSSKPYTMLAQSKPYVKYDFVARRFIGLGPNIECSVNRVTWMSSEELVNEINSLTGVNYVYARYKPSQNKMPGEIAVVALVQIPQIVIKSDAEVVFDNRNDKTYIFDDKSDLLTAKYIANNINGNVSLHFNDVKPGFNVEYRITGTGYNISNQYPAVFDFGTGSYRLDVFLKDNNGTTIATQTVAFKVYKGGLGSPVVKLEGTLGEMEGGIQKGYKVKVVTDADPTTIVTATIKKKDSGNVNVSTYDFYYNNGRWEGKEIYGVPGRYEVAIKYENPYMRPSTVSTEAKIEFIIDSTETPKVWITTQGTTKVGKDVENGILKSNSDGEYEFEKTVQLSGIDGEDEFNNSINPSDFVWINDESKISNYYDASGKATVNYVLYVKYKLDSDTVWRNIAQDGIINYVEQGNGRLYNKYNLKVFVKNLKNGYLKEYEYEFKVTP